jgi:hypothetical protein
MDDFEVFSVYTRAQALADGVLIDVSDLAKEAGFKWPVAVTDHLYHGYIVPTLDLVSAGQSISGRLWDVLSVLRAAISTGKDLSSLNITVSFLMAPNAAPEPVEFLALAGPGDSGEPVITIMLPEDY